MNDTFTAQKYCVLGAGPAGLTVAKNFLARGIACDVLEREADLGGNWNYAQASSSVYASTHLISSKRLTEFTDFPMPKEFPPYPSHRQALDYLRAYAEHFGVVGHIQFGAAVEKVSPHADGSWLVQVAGEESPRRYAGVVIANGHHWDPLPCQLPGEFTGRIIHSRDYKTPDQLRGRRVLVVGAGNSGCDIAVEAAQHADIALLSMRRGYHFLPKFLHGRPIDLSGENMHRWHWPLWLQRAVAGVMVRIALGRPQRYGLPKPDHKLFETHPVVNSQLLYYVGHGRIRVVPAIERLCGDRVRFVDGQEADVDLIVLAVGYKVSFPFLDPSLVLDERGRPHLFLNAFHSRYDNFFVAGLLQPNSGLWGLVDYQAQLMAAFIVAQQQDPRAADAFRELKRTRPELAHGIRFIDSPRHVLEVEYFSYRERLKKLLKRFRPGRLAPVATAAAPATAAHA
jgi:cation diffusion facilitator CzcD-associated flavoprotein CzcO